MTEYANRREYPRLAMILGAQLESAGRSFLAVTKDISRTGALLWCEGRYETGDRVELVLVGKGSPDEYRLEGKVVRATRRTAEGPLRWDLAFSFEKALAEDSPLLAEVKDEAPRGEEPAGK